MHFADFRQPLVIFACTLALLLGAGTHIRAEAGTSALSGRVVDAEGNPIAGLPLAIQPIYGIDIATEEVPNPLTISHSQTDSAGRFRITGIVPGLVQFGVLPKTGAFEPDTEILLLEIRGLSFFPAETLGHFILRRSAQHERLRFGTDRLNTLKTPVAGVIPFHIKPEVDIRDIKVTVRSRTSISGQIVLADGGPLPDTTGTVRIEYQSLDGVHTGSFSNTTVTDSNGRFIKYVNFHVPMYCTVSVEYGGGQAMGDTFLLEVGQRREGLVFRLSHTPFSNVNVAPTPPEAVQMPPPVPLMQGTIGAWAVNPANSHAYKKIRCESWEDARATAIAEGAHLVSINDEADQKWLMVIFGHEPFWIGLTRLAEATKWQWTSGEPVEYTNWGLRGSDGGAKDSVFVGITNGKWHIGGPESSRRIGIALLEKDNFGTAIPFEDK